MNFGLEITKKRLVRHNARLASSRGGDQLKDGVTGTGEAEIGEPGLAAGAHHSGRTE